METLKAVGLKLLDPAILLGAAILLAWLAMKFLKYEGDAGLDNVVMIVVGFIWGSSAGSKDKDKKNEPAKG